MIIWPKWLVQDSDHTPSSLSQHSSLEFVASNTINPLQYTWSPSRVVSGPKRMGHIMWPLSRTWRPPDLIRRKVIWQPIHKISKQNISISISNFYILHSNPVNGTWTHMDGFIYNNITTAWSMTNMVHRNTCWENIWLGWHLYTGNIGWDGIGLHGTNKILSQITLVVTLTNTTINLSSTQIIKKTYSCHYIWARTIVESHENCFKLGLGKTIKSFSFWIIPI